MLELKWNHASNNEWGITFVDEGKIYEKYVS